ncbi:MAG: putative Co/Zn/Cd efflux system membrane fusion protein [Cytophagales bacterium]|jgi:Cu(I)/Ag(I) efflux system membrane fusion protein|nr:efflux RND transporter periplasmic adaptor subunit [Bacteroidota bacterium]MBS1950728.1 efflux RND transporter periplasmic adaptor subunit [Bacteroidota bacterium]MBS1980712.1 efflux RND transporter periplasmic adaptor subunit [Bacteroidota bacterium]WHZ08045.1 MAG: putative Co/Zn/Cd efflux system membrane fusion protein [Cytophagales bacterium]
MNKICIYLLLLILVVSCDKKSEQLHQGHDGGNDAMLTLSDQDRVVIKLLIDTAATKTMYEETTLIGTAAIDERAINVISARVKGRVDKLFARNPGTYVKNGDPLYSIYSEELLSYENEYLLAIDENRTATTQKAITQRMVEAARRRLELWTLTEKQINELEKTKNISPLIIFYSNRNGYLSELLVREGEYVEIGSPLFRLADLNSLWIESQLYSNEVNFLKQSPTLEIEFEAFPNERIQGEIVYDNPRLEDNTKINLVRIKVNNQKGNYKPGMMAYVYLKRNRKETLVIPKSALLLENNVIVWVETPDGMFEQRMVDIGIQNKREVEILSGLSIGDKVVTRGGFLLNSAWKVKQGGGAMEGMKM